jgi:hypothetical protein
VKKEKSPYERLRDSQNPIVKEEEFVKGLCDSQRLRESLNPTVKGIPTERPETTTSCGLNPTVKGIPAERPETTTSCGLNLRTMCGSRTGGWSLPCVMSD